MTDLLAILVIIAIVVVLLDGVRRKLRDRRNRVVIKLDRNISAEELNLDEIPLSELPNGGARRLERQSDEIPVIRRKPQVLPSIRKARESGESALGAVPVLMEKIELDEEDIEHTNVFAESGATNTFIKEDFDEEEPGFEDEADDDEIIDGLDEEFAADISAKRTRSANGIVEVDELDDEYDDDLEYDVEEQLVPDRLVVSADDVRSPDVLSGFEEDEELDFDEDDDFEYEAAPVAPPVARKAILEQAVDAEDFDDEEVGTDSFDYENEPLLLQDVYNKAAGHFKRPTEQRPRIEPGFGGHSFQDDELEEDFSSSFLDDPELNEELQEEMRPIRVVPRPTPKPPQKPEPKLEQRIEQRIEQRTELRTEYKSEPDRDEVRAPAETLVRPTPAESWPPKTSVPVPRVATPARRNEAPKPVANKKDQGELFRDDHLRRSAEQEQKAEPPGPQEVIIINVMARQGAVFAGSDLLPILRKQGLHLGEMSIFHRHADLDGNGQVMFSMANMVKPGTFNLATMDNFSTPGVSFFLQLPNKLGNLPSFEKMLAAASAVKVSLDGEFKDENRSVFTRQTVEHCRQRIQDFELALLKRK